MLLRFNRFVQMLGIAILAVWAGSGGGISASEVRQNCDASASSWPYVSYSAASDACWESDCDWICYNVNCVQEENGPSCVDYCYSQDEYPEFCDIEEDYPSPPWWAYTASCRCAVDEVVP